MFEILITASLMGITVGYENIGNYEHYAQCQEQMIVEKNEALKQAKPGEVEDYYIDHMGIKAKIRGFDITIVCVPK